MHTADNHSYTTGPLPQRPQQEERPPKNNRSWIIFTILGVVLVALLVGALVLFNHVANKADGPTANTSTDTTITVETTPTSTGSDSLGEATIGDSGLPGVSTTVSGEVPDFTMTDVNGNLITLSALRGMPLVMNFWATWCAPCRDELDAFQKMYNQYGTQVNFVMLDIGGQGDTPATVQKFCKDHGYTFPLFFDDGDGTTLFGVTGVPETVFINAQGQSYGKVVGGMSESMLAKGMKLLTKQ